MRTLAVLLLGFVLLAPLIGCGSGGGREYEGFQECRNCSSTEQCDEGLTCFPFADGRSRCARFGSTCR